MKKPSSYTLLWCLLAAALVIFVAISFLDGDLLPFKQGTFKEALTKTDGTPEEPSDSFSPGEDIITKEIADTALDASDTREGAPDKKNDEKETATATRDGEKGATVTSQQTKEQVTDTEATRVETAHAPAYDDRPLTEPDPNVGSVLLFGDSMTSLIARRLGEYGAKNGYTVHSVTWDGSSTQRWADTDRIENYIRDFHPNFIFITLGSNEVSRKNMDGIAANVKKIISKFGGIPYIWIGPPIWIEDKKFDEMMLRTLPSGKYFVSDMELERQKDHIHPTFPAGVIWTDAVMEWMKRSPHAIKAQRPDSKATTLDKISIPIKTKK